MRSFGDASDSFSEIEAMVRAAAGCVRASDDLRPRVLESARSQFGQRRAQRCVRRFAVFALLAAGFTASAGRSPMSGAAGPESRWGIAESIAIERRADQVADRSSDVGWAVVDAFTELRERQSEALRLAL